MALRAVIDHPKFTAFKMRLGLTRGAALGYLEAMWHFCGRFTPHGNIGKYSDLEIESWVEWDGESGALIEALVACRWLDKDDTYRLLVHDWARHADDATKLAVKRSEQPFCKVCPDSVATVSPQGSDYQGQGQGQVSGAEPEKKEPSVPKKFVKPTVEECQAYAEEIQIPTLEGERFFDYWESLGWKRKAGPMVDWKASLRTWKSSYNSRPENSGSAPKRRRQASEVSC